MSRASPGHLALAVVDLLGATERGPRADERGVLAVLVRGCGVTHGGRRRGDQGPAIFVARAVARQDPPRAPASLLDALAAQRLVGAGHDKAGREHGIFHQDTSISPSSLRYRSQPPKSRLDCTRLSTASPAAPRSQNPAPCRLRVSQKSCPTCPQSRPVTARNERIASTLPTANRTTSSRICRCALGVSPALTWSNERTALPFSSTTSVDQSAQVR